MSRIIFTTVTIILVFAFSTSSSSAFYFRKSRASCPTVTTKPDFDYRPYAGLWYESFRMENVFEEGSTCERAIYDEISEGLVSVVNTAVLADGTLYNITGTARAISAEQPGYLIVSFPGRPDGTYLVLDTDYVDYSSVYSCSSLGAFSFEYAWLLSRNQTISPSSLITALSKYSQFGIDIAKFNQTLQGPECIYYPEYPFPK